jgi:ATP adenylyltransferase
MAKTEHPIVEQAGGIVLWGENVVLRCTKARHLVLPKGHIEPGETPERTAIREIQEECGLIAEIVGVAGSISFKKKHALRRVTFYLMRVIGETDEIHEHLGKDTFPVPAKWAEHLLTFKNTRRLLKAVEPQIERLLNRAA